MNTPECQKRWRINNQEHWQKYRKEYESTHKGKNIEKQKRFKNSEKGKAYFKRYRKENADRLNANQRRYENKNWFGIPLTAREQEVYNLMNANEYTAAKQLNITVGGLQSHKRKIRKKLGL